MSTGKQLQANRLNAQRSTGSRTPEGKAGASLNAVRHRLLARSSVLPQEDRAQFRLERFARIETGFLMDRSASLRYWDRREAGLGDRKEPYVDPASLPPDEHTYQRSIKPLRAPGSPQPAGAKRTQILPSANRAPDLAIHPSPPRQTNPFRRHPPRAGALLPIHRRPVLRHLPRRWGISPKWPLRTARTARFWPLILSGLGAIPRPAPVASRVLPVNCGQTATAL